MDQRSKIAILGFGIEGRSVFEYLLKHNYDEITVCDQNVDIKEDMPNGVSVRLGPHYLNDLTDFEVVFRSPGVRYLDPNVQNALANGVEVTSSIGFFMDQCPCPVIGVTGTKGKGTTASLIYEIFKKAKKSVFLGGNIGNPAIEFLDDLKGDDIVVLELSSFQLQDINKSPKYTVLLNTTSDHLDYHADEAEYLSAKESILKNQNKDGIAVLNMDYPYMKYYEPLVQGEKRFVSVESRVEDGAFANDGEIFYATYGDVEKICDTKDVALIGSHNLENILPSIVICKELGIDNEHIVEVIKEFEGLPHRLEFVKEVNGVKYYNDSFSTTPETSMAAVDAFEVPTILIAGGSDKGADFSEWALKILTRPSLETVVLVGDTAEKMEEAIYDAEEKLGDAEGSPTKVFRAADLASAVEKAASNSIAGGVIVMSPASASFDAFKNYKQRGETFRKLVKEL